MKKLADATRRHRKKDTPVTDTRLSQAEHRLFLATVLGKAALGLIQIVTAVGLATGTAAQLPTILQWMFSNELAEDPTDFIVTKVLALANAMPATPDVFYVYYFAIHGGLHLIVAAALLYGARWAYDFGIVMLGAFVIYQMAEWISVGGPTLLILTVVDLIVIALTWRERRAHPPT